jgi:hypothetical protein
MMPSFLKFSRQTRKERAVARAQSTMVAMEVATVHRSGRETPTTSLTALARWSSKTHSPQPNAAGHRLASAVPALMLTTRDGREEQEIVKVDGRG